MIVRAYKCQGSRHDDHQLERHLSKTDGQRPEQLEFRNVWARDVATGLAVMRALKAGAPKARIAFWHIIVSPRFTLSSSERRRVVAMIVKELCAEEHPLIVISHNEKPRARQGGGANHLHVLLGHVSPGFRALDTSHIMPKLHKVMALAAYYIEGVPTPSPYHRSIVAALSREKFPDVARWLIDELGDCPVFKPPRMSDSMRRAAQAAGFNLPLFQAILVRLWTTGAGQRDIEFYLDQSSVTAQEGRTKDVIVLYRGTLFVGALHRILQRDATSVRAEAELRVPCILSNMALVSSYPHGSEPASCEREGGPPTSEGDRSFVLRRQQMIDWFEDKLVKLRSERLDLAYGRSNHLLDVNFPGGNDAPNSATESTAFQPHASGQREAGADKIIDRVTRLLHAESALEAAVKLLWQDERWVDRSPEELVCHAARGMKTGKMTHTELLPTSPDGEPTCSTDEARQAFEL